MNACDLLTKDIGRVCNRHDVGLKSMGYIFNREDFDSLEDFTLKSDSKGYRFHQDGKQPFNGTNSTLVVGAMRSYYTHQINAVIFDKEVVEMLRGGEFVVVVDRGFTGDEKSNESFEAFGITNGMTLTEATHDYYSEETDAGWAVVLTEERARIGMGIFTSVAYATAKASLEAMCGEIADEPSGEASVTGEVLNVDGSVSGEVLTLKSGSVSEEILTI